MSSSRALVRHRRYRLMVREFEKIPSVDSCKFFTANTKHIEIYLTKFSFLYGDHSISPLKITREMLVRILSYYQVMPSYLDFLFVFGLHKHSREKRFSGFRGDLKLAKGQNLPIQSLGRSGRQFQLCYNLKTVAKWTETGQLNPSLYHWTIRQGAFYHQFDVDNGTSLWLITRSGLDIKQRIETMTGPDGQSDDRQFQSPKQCLESSLSVHLLLCHWSSENWRAYLQWLEDTVENEVRKCLFNPRLEAYISVLDLRRGSWPSRPWSASTESFVLPSTESPDPWRRNQRSHYGAKGQQGCVFVTAKLLPEFAGEWSIQHKRHLSLGSFLIHLPDR